MKNTLIYISILLLSFVALYNTQKILNDKPVIAIMMHHSGSKSYPKEEWSQIPASYVKYLEMAGARVMPIHYDGDKQYYDEVFEQINGLLFTGGGVSFKKTTYLGQNGYYMFQKAIKANQNGVHFPIWGTCLGFEMIMTFSQDFDKEILGDISGEDDVTRTIKVLDEGKLFGNMPKEILHNVQTEPLSYYHHSHDVTPKTYHDSEKLKKFWKLSATSNNLKGDTFIAAVESRNYPIFGTQFHPEKTSFEWKVNANHSLMAVQMEQYYADFFVQNARMNNHKYTNEQFKLIFDFNPIYITSPKGYIQVYYFKSLKIHNEILEDYQEY